MPRERVLTIVSLLCLMVGCKTASPQPKGELRIAASADLRRALGDVREDYKGRTGIRIVTSYDGASGTAYDVVLADDAGPVDRLIAAGDCFADSRALYARGSVVFWAPKRPDLRLLSEMTRPDIQGIAFIDPANSAYGSAAVEAMKNAGLWEAIQSRNVAWVPDAWAARRYVGQSKGDGSFTALSLVSGFGIYFLIDEKLYKPIEQALCVATKAKDPAAARAFTAYLRSDAGYGILQRYGYGRL